MTLFYIRDNGLKNIGNLSLFFTYLECDLRACKVWGMESTCKVLACQKSFILTVIFGLKLILCLQV